MRLARINEGAALTELIPNETVLCLLFLAVLMAYFIYLEDILLIYLNLLSICNLS
jgi:hypothetical protein